MLNATIDKVTSLSPIETKWRNLERQCDPTFFISWTWIGPWAKLVANETDLYLFTLEENKNPVAMCFFTICESKRLKGIVSSKQIQINEYLANGCNMVIQYNSVLAHQNDLQIAWKYLFDTLNQWNKTWDEIEISSLKKHDLEVVKKINSQFRFKIDKEHSIWIVPLDSECENIDILLSRLKAKSRRQLRQSIKAFENEYGEISYVIAQNLDQAILFFEKMEALHKIRWEQAGKPGSYANEKWVNFHKNVIKEGFPGGEILLIEIRAGNTVIGYLYGHPHKGTAYMQQTGFATMQENRLKPGYVSHFYTMLCNARNNIISYDFLPDDIHSYKKFFTNASGNVSWIRFQRPRIKFYIEDVIRYLSSRLNSILYKQGHD